MPITDYDIILIKDVESLEKKIRQKIFDEVQKTLSEKPELIFDKIEIDFNESTFSFSLKINFKNKNDHRQG